MDTLTVGGISLPKQAMGLAEEESLDFALAMCDGLFVRSFLFCHFHAFTCLCYTFLFLVSHTLSRSPFY